MSPAPSRAASSPSPFSFAVAIGTSACGAGTLKRVAATTYSEFGFTKGEAWLPAEFGISIVSTVSIFVRSRRAIRTHRTADGYYHLDLMLKSFVRKGGQIACCGTCMDARGLTKDHLIEEAPRSTMDELAAWTVDADRVLTF